MAMASTYLVINPGSSSIRYALYHNEQQIFHAHFTQDAGQYRVVFNHQEHKIIQEENYNESLQYLQGYLMPYSISIIGIRIVALGTFFTVDRIIDAQFIEQLQHAYKNAPLHLVPVFLLIQECQRYYATAQLCGISDSAFHVTMPEHARIYGISCTLAKKHDIYRFGYHGLSVESVAEIVKKHSVGFYKRIIVCHLGSGSSVTALFDGVSIDTSMGFTPLDGIPMFTRSGSLDPAVALLVQKNIPDALLYLAHECGIYSIAGINNFEQLLKRAELLDEQAQLALDLYVYSIKKYIGAYWALLGGLDLLVFTGGVGEHYAAMRARVCETLGDLEIALNPAKNNGAIYVNTIEFIEHETSSLKIAVVATNELAQMAQHIKALLKV